VYRKAGCVWLPTDCCMRAVVTECSAHVGHIIALYTEVVARRERWCRSPCPQSTRMPVFFAFEKTRCRRGEESSGRARPLRDAGFCGCAVETHLQRAMTDGPDAFGGGCESLVRKAAGSPRETYGDCSCRSTPKNCRQSRPAPRPCASGRRRIAGLHSCGPDRPHPVTGRAMNTVLYAVVA